MDIDINNASEGIYYDPKPKTTDLPCDRPKFNHTPVVVPSYDEVLKVEVHEPKKPSIYDINPRNNVITKEQFEDRAQKVFKLAWESLSKSFGPYGAPTIICNYPYRHVTKDGFTIMKNLSMDTANTLLDQAILDMASDICGRLNFTVGDGTTSAVIATNSIYQNYLKIKKELDLSMILPRDIIKRFNALKEEINEKLGNVAIPIMSDNKDELYENIKDVVYISSNGDETITNYIAEFYKKLGAPAITCELSPDGVTRASDITGYKFNLCLNDRIYINSDNDTMELNGADIVIFTKRITLNTYQYILKPLNEHCRVRGRHLIVAAPLYDEVALSNVISKELTLEFEANHDVNMVLCTYKAISAHSKRLLSDFAMLMGATMISSNLEEELIDNSKRDVNIAEIFNIDNRKIPGINIIARNIKANKAYSFADVPGAREQISADEILFKNQDTDPKLGYTSHCKLGLKTSLFSGEMYYNEALYKATVDEAKAVLKETEDKYAKLGTFNVEVSQAQERLYSLKLAMGLIEVGADSDLSQGMIKDSVDDSIKAAASAFNHGVVYGCNLDLIRILDELKLKYTSPVDQVLIDILFNGFRDVYKTVLANAFSDVKLCTTLDLNDTDKIASDALRIIKSFFADKNKYNEKLTIDNTFGSEYELKGYILEFIRAVKDKPDEFTLHNFIIFISMENREVFDVSSFTFSEKVINSVETDRQILTATIDLISILMTGNQFLVTQKHNF